MPLMLENIWPEISLPKPLADVANINPPNLLKVIPEMQYPF